MASHEYTVTFFAEPADIRRTRHNNYKNKVIVHDKLECMTQPSAKFIASSCWLVHVRAVSPTRFPAFLVLSEPYPSVLSLPASISASACLASLWLVKTIECALKAREFMRNVF